MKAQLAEIWTDLCAWGRTHPVVAMLAGAGAVLILIAVFR